MRRKRHTILMRLHATEFCLVCRWLIVQRIRIQTFHSSGKKQTNRKSHIFMAVQTAYPDDYRSTNQTDFPFFNVV